jgi:carotenoid cleavage dioxygenase-like enzyme
MLANEGKGVVAAIPHPKDCIAGEAVFVPRQAGLAPGDTTNEDDGFLIAYASNRKTMKSFCMVRARRHLLFYCMLRCSLSSLSDKWMRLIGTAVFALKWRSLIA